MPVNGFRVIRPQDRVPDAASGAMRREAAISGSMVGATKLWFGYAELPPGAISAAHHHGASESGIFMIAGQARFFTGPALTQVLDANPGDFIWVPPHVMHVEMNRSPEAPVRMAVVRSTQEAIVVNLDAPVGWQPSRDPLR